MISCIQSSKSAKFINCITSHDSGYALRGRMVINDCEK